MKILLVTMNSQRNNNVVIRHGIQKKQLNKMMIYKLHTANMNLEDMEVLPVVRR